MGPTVRILGTHGVPAAYGGFETAAEHVGLHLKDKGWRVIVYCQIPGSGPTSTDDWNGLERVLIREPREGWRGTSSFDLRSVRHALAEYETGEVWLTFGYNTGIFDLAPRAKGIPNVINMDGMEWTRKRWGLAKQALLLANERFAGLFADILIADHPVIATYLRRHFGRRRVMTITYGAHETAGVTEGPVVDEGLTPGGYGIVVCRPIPENSVLEIVKAWSSRHRGMPLVVVGPYESSDPYHAQVMAAASEEVVFPGPIFESTRIGSLRHHAAIYLHGHTVGGTNPSLVEAMAAGNPVVAHRNAYNTWVAGDGNAYFDDEHDLSRTLDELLEDPARLQKMGASSLSRFREEFTWEMIGDQYEAALLRALDKKAPNRIGAAR